MFVVLDTNHFAELVHDTVLGGRLKRRFLKRAAQVFTTIITAQEVAEGWCAFIRKQRAGSEKQIHGYQQFQHSLELLMEFTVLAFDEQAAGSFLHLRRILPQAGTQDLKIAAVCLAHDATLLTRNVGDFNRVPGLRVENWLVTGDANIPPFRLRGGAHRGVFSAFSFSVKLRALRLLISFLAVSASAVTAMEAIRLSTDGKSFVQGESGKPFRVWGVNYDHDSTEKGRLLEDYWEKEWDTVRGDFQEMKDLGANVVRIHLQTGKFMDAPEQPNEKSLAQLRRLLALAEETGLYLDLTGLGCYHKADVPAWYDAMDESARWSVQARFWSAVAKTCRDSSAVFCYDLMNEPVIGGNTEEGWLAGELGGKHFVQRLTLEPGKRTQIEIAKAWVDKLTAAIRAEDPKHLITVGVIPWALVWPNAKPVFYAPEVSPALDFVSIHLYPKKGGVEKALTAMTVYDIGKPLVIEETFPLECGLEEMDDFLKRSRDRAEGYVSFYWGRTIKELAEAKDNPMAAAILGEWLKYFQKHSSAMKQP